MSSFTLPSTRKVGHLTLLRQGREISSREYNRLASSERLEMVRHARGRQKYALIVEASDGERLVPQLATQELYLMLRELGLEDMAEVVALFGPEQLTTLMDMDIWGEEDIDPKKSLVWLQLLLDAGPERVCQMLPALEQELVVLIFSRQVRVLHGPEMFDDDDAVQNANRLEGLYDLEYSDPENAKLIAGVLDVLFRDRRPFFLWLMEAIRSDTPSMHLEQAYQFHRSRMQDHGFADPLEARMIYAYQNPHVPHPDRTVKIPVAIPEESATPPSYLMTTVGPQDLLSQVLAEGVDQETAWEFSLLLNKIMSADGVDVGDAKAVEATLQRVFRTLNLGLEHLAEGYLEQAQKLFPQLYLQDLFRTGFSLTLELRHWAEKLRQSPISGWLDQPYVHLLDALIQPKPRFYPGLGRDGETQLQDFETRQQIRQVSVWLEEIEAQEHLFDGGFAFDLPDREGLDLIGCLPNSAAELTLSDIFLTALANKLLDGEFVPEPLSADRLPELHAIITTDGHLDPQLREGTIDWLEELQPDAGGFGHYCLDVWEQAFCPLTAADLDPRYIGGLMIRLAP